MKAVNVANLSDDGGSKDWATTTGRLEGVATSIKKFFDVFFKIRDFNMNIKKSSDFSLHGFQKKLIAFRFCL